MKKEQQILIIMVIGLVAYVYIYFSFMLTSINKKISETKKLISDKSAKLNEAKLLAESLPLLQQETKMLELEIVELEKKLPKQTNLPELIKIIGKEAQNHDIKLNSIVRQPVDSSAAQFNEIPFSIQFTANFHSLGQFFVSLAQGQRIFAAKDLVLSYSGNKDYSVNGACTIFAYSLK